MNRATGRKTTVNRLADRIYNQLKDELYVQLKPGDRLTESAVAERLDASRTPTREALQRLVQEGHLNAHLRNGYTVRSIDQSTLNDLYAVRVLLETEAVRLYCAGSSDSSLSPLMADWEVAHSEQISDPNELGRLNESYHFGIVALSGNRELIRLHGDIFQRIQLIQRLDFSREERVDATYDEHLAVLQSMVRGESEKASDILRQHIVQSLDMVSEITRQFTVD